MRIAKSKIDVEVPEKGDRAREVFRQGFEDTHAPRNVQGYNPVDVRDDQTECLLEVVCTSFFVEDDFQRRGP